MTEVAGSISTGSHCPAARPPARPSGRRVRSDFPILATTVRGKPLVYLDNAATSQKPQAVIDALSRFYAGENANIHRGVHFLSERATLAYDRVRAQVARIRRARHRRARSCSPEAPPRRSTSWPRAGAERTLGPGDEIVDHRDGAPLQHRSLAAALRADRCGAPGRARHRRAASSTSTPSSDC